MTKKQYALFISGQIGMMALARFFFQWVVAFAKEGGTPAPDGTPTPLFAATAAGFLFLAFRIFDGVTDPVAGILSDGWVRRGRERRSLLWFSFLVPSVGLALLFAPDDSMASGLRWTLHAAGMFVFFVGYTFYAIPYWSLIDDYSGADLEARTRLSTLLGAGILIATTIGFVASPILVERLGFFAAAVIFAVPAALLMLGPYFARPDHGTSSKSAPTAAGQGPTGLAAFKTAFGHARFRAVIVLFAGSQMSFTVMTSAAPFVAVDLLGGTVGDVTALFGPFLGTAILSFAIVPVVVRRFGWERSTVVATLALGAAYGGVGLVGVDLVGGPVVTAMLLFAIAGPMAAVLLGVEGRGHHPVRRRAGGRAHQRLLRRLQLRGQGAQRGRGPPHRRPRRPRPPRERGAQRGLGPGDGLPGRRGPGPRRDRLPGPPPPTRDRHAGFPGRRLRSGPPPPGPTHRRNRRDPGFTVA